jgi:hypothetical protein
MPPSDPAILIAKARSGSGPYTRGPVAYGGPLGERALQDVDGFSSKAYPEPHAFMKLELCEREIRHLELEIIILVGR